MYIDYEEETLALAQLKFLRELQGDENHCLTFFFFMTGNVGTVLQVSDPFSMPRHVPRLFLCGNFF